MSNRALLFYGVLLLAPPVHAVYLSNAGTGQALLYPHYTVRAAGANAFNTYVSVTNTSLTPLVAKVRFREGRAGRAVADFNLYLGQGDTWTGAVVPATSGAHLVSQDRSCTNPLIPSSGLQFGADQLDADGAGAAATRVQEGYFEVIEMGTLPSTVGAFVNPRSPFFDCARVQGSAPDLGTLGVPTGALSGSATLINVSSGLDAAYVPDMLGGLTSTAFYSPPGTAGTDFSSPQIDPVSHAVVGNVAYRMTWSRGIDAVNSVLMSEYFENDFVLDVGTRSRTDWIVTFPTRPMLVSTSMAQPPFTAAFMQGSCEGFRVEQAFDVDGRLALGSDFPERPPSQFRMCWTATGFPIRATGEVMSSTSSDVLASQNTLGLPSSLATGAFAPTGIAVPADFRSGRMQVRFDGLGFLTSLGTTTRTNLSTGQTSTGSVQVRGYPAIAFMVRTFENGALTCGAAMCQGNYASAFPHRRVNRVFPQ